MLNDLKTSLKGRIDEEVAISGNVEIGEGTVVHGGATLRGLW